MWFSVRQGTTDDTDATDIHRLLVHQLSVPIGVICVLCGQIFMFILLSREIILPLCMNSVTTAVV